MDRDETDSAGKIKWTKSCQNLVLPTTGEKKIKVRSTIDPHPVPPKVLTPSSFASTRAMLEKFRIGFVAFR